MRGHAVANGEMNVKGDCVRQGETGWRESHAGRYETDQLRKHVQCRQNKICIGNDGGCFLSMGRTHN